MGVGGGATNYKRIAADIFHRLVCKMLNSQTVSSGSWSQVVVTGWLDRVFVRANVRS